MYKERFQIGEYYLVRHPNSPVYKAGWYDAKTGQTCRASLRTKDPEEAKIALFEFVQAQLKPKDYDTADMPLGTVLTRYYDHHAINLPSEEAARHALVHWLDFWGPSTIADLTH